MEPVEHAGLAADFAHARVDPNQLRWLPMPLPPAHGGGGGSSAAASGAAAADSPRVDWLEGLRTMAGNGDPTTKSGLAIHMYACNASMVDKALHNSDGDFLIVSARGRRAARAPLTCAAAARAPALPPTSSAYLRRVRRPPPCPVAAPAGAPNRHAARAERDGLPGRARQ